MQVIQGEIKRPKMIGMDEDRLLERLHELIRKSTIVLSHYSTALSFAVIYRKPILLVTTNEYFNSYRKYQFLAFSEALKTDIINVDK